MIFLGLFLLFYICVFVLKGEDSVTQPPGDVITTEGGQVTLACTFDTEVASSYLFWYKQGSNDHTKYMLMRPEYGDGDNAPEFKDRFDADLDTKTKSVPLTIQSLQLSDTAVYYCALRPTVTTGYTAPLQKHIVGHNDNTPVRFYYMLIGPCLAASDCICRFEFTVVGHRLSVNVGLAPLSQCNVHCMCENIYTHAQNVIVINVDHTNLMPSGADSRYDSRSFRISDLIGCLSDWRQH
uniref:Ig-like domain-containing protein n=1 Tax=Esox lucius TaxID=8010 RepID=A0AAY5K5K4_ESOLU